MSGLLGLVTLPAKFKLYALVGVGALVVTAGAFGGGYVVGQRNLALKQTKESGKEVVKYIDQQAQDRVEVKVRDLKRERELQASLDAIKAERDTLRDILHEKPDPDSSVYLRVGDVRMLNDAANPTVPPTGVPDPATLASYQEQTPSSVGLRQFTGTELDVRTQYKALAQRCDALIDWVDVELIQHQLNNKKKKSK